MAETRRKPCLNQTNKKVKTFKLSIFKGHELKETKEVIVNSKEDLKYQKNGFWMESPYSIKNIGFWMGIKRVR